MTKLVFYNFRGCPYCERVRAKLEEKKIEFEDTLIDREDRTEVVKASGQPLVPVIVDNGTAVFDTEKILAYLDEHF